MFRLLLILTTLILPFSSVAYERVVLLAPAAGDILIQLGKQDSVVGVTRSNHDFPNAKKIGSHIKPNIELIKSLNPDLIIIGSSRFFGDEMAALFEAKIKAYRPTTLANVITEIRSLGELLECSNKARELINHLEYVLKQLQPLPTSPTAVYEITEVPLTIAGKGNIASDIIAKAGGRLLAPSDRKLIKFNTESLLKLQPDFYFYQVGPMNPNPQPPQERGLYQLLSSEYIQVDQLRFSRANSQSFYLAVELNQYFAKSLKEKQL